MVILSQKELTIASEDDVVLVRRAVRELSIGVGFDAFATAALTTAASELTRNALVHGRGGRARIEHLSQQPREGIRVEFLDEGPGIEDVARVLEGGYSTARSLGLGLSGSRRLVDEFELDTAPGRGTRVVVIKWRRF